MTSMRQELNARIRGEWTDIQGHLEFLYETVVDIGTHLPSRAKVGIIELGVRTGQSTCAFLAALEQVSGTLWSVDSAPPEVPPEWLSLPGWKYLQADDLSEAALAFLPKRCDVLFIDTTHGYEHTLTELTYYVPRVRRGGVVLLHDTQFAPPGTDLGKPDGDVARALDEYCQAHVLAWENRPGFYGLGVIRI